MFFSSPSADINLMIVFLVVALILSLVTYVFSRKILVGVVTFSVLSNVVLYLGIDHNLAKMYNILGFFSFVRNIWPYINLLLFAAVAIIFLKKKYEK